ncbi:acyltransferase family protein [Bacillus sp. REN16]|uniref:acyltransferase family protein n=1 Tax=Bacillus sp. REN16 TaxID=2887296 RepID=UPI001E64A93B|nr:acyltransferase family protein [Bacillus sp. REN16]MCC3356907.1 acyltransferase family protein [Bacillus sp. REN16]
MAFFDLRSFIFNNDRISNVYKGLLNVLCVYIFYSLISILVRVYHFHDTKSITDWIYSILSFQANGYSWYVNMYIGIFLLILFLNLIFNGLNTRKERHILILTFLLLSGVPNFVNVLPVLINESRILYFPDWWAGIYPLTYFFIGCYIREYRPKVNKPFALLSFVFIILVETFLCYYYSDNGPFVDAVGYYGPLMIIASSVLFFIIFYDIDIKNKVLSSIFGTLGGLTLDIFLASFISDLLVYEYIRNNVFESQFQIIYYFVPIIGTILMISIAMSLIRKYSTWLLKCNSS